MDDAVRLLQELGFGDYEARAYVALLQRNPLNGYELAKVSGIPRANIYGVLHKLEQRGAIAHIDTAAGTQYAPIPPDELVQRLGGRFQDTLGQTQQSLSDLTTPAEREYVWNSQGYDDLLAQARALIETAQQRLVLALFPQESQALDGPLAGAAARGVEITTLCLYGCPQECGHCRGHIFRYRAAPESGARWLLLIADDAEVLSGEIDGDGAQAVRTRQRLLVELSARYIRHSIALFAALADLGDGVDTLLQPATREALATLGTPGDNWLDHVRDLAVDSPGFTPEPGDA